MCADKAKTANGGKWVILIQNNHHGYTDPTKTIYMYISYFLWSLRFKELLRSTLGKPFQSLAMLWWYSIPGLGSTKMKVVDAV